MLLSLGAAAANKILGYLAAIIQTGLFLDTAFIITATFSGGLGAGLLASLITTAIGGICHHLFWGLDWFWGWYFYGLCFAATALVTWLFARSFPKECMPLRLNSRQLTPSSGPENPLLDRIIMLSLLSLALWFIISVMGSFISVFNSQILHVIPAEEWIENDFKLGLLQQGLSPVIAEFLARVPINIIDRPISVLIGYGTSLLLKKIQSLTVPPGAADH
ncbi:hypothetical protein AGMMS50293_28040 [Spirochaetia bacterium]|nr:hypothetical protein AGMMS50293_28040 [Spirochaetia bacterium]